MGDALDSKGFVFLDANNRPFRCAMWGNKPWLFYWQEAQKRWVTLRPVSQMEIFSFPHNLTQEEQDLYYNKA